MEGAVEEVIEMIIEAVAAEIVEEKVIAHSIELIAGMIRIEEAGIRNRY